jgi:hypothetical protein
LGRVGLLGKVGLHWNLSRIIVIVVEFPVNPELLDVPPEFPVPATDVHVNWSWLGVLPHPPCCMHQLLDPVVSGWGSTQVHVCFLKARYCVLRLFVMLSFLDNFITATSVFRMLQRVPDCGFLDQLRKTKSIITQSSVTSS